MALFRSPLGAAASLLYFIAAVQAFPRQSPHKRDASFTSEGCYVDNANGHRALTGACYDDDLMTVESCAVFCSKYKFFGLEYGRECYCGDALSAQSADDSDCSFPCAGNAAEKCGAGDRLNVYTNTLYSPASPATLDVPYLGCFVDHTYSRILPYNLLGSDDMTAAKCAEHCSNSNYSFFGVEYGRECWCGDSLPTTAAPESECSFTCAGDDTQLCGAGDRINVWGAPVASPDTVADFDYLGCYTDHVEQRSLTGKATSDSAMTLATCAAACSAYPYFGVEYSTQCYCGTQLEGTAEKRPQIECSMRCGGEPNQVCGGADRVNIFHSAQRTGDASNLDTVGGFTYKSCWTDDVSARSLTGHVERSDDMTVEKCAAVCQGFTYFGVEFANECFCGNELPGEAASEDTCSELCVGDSRQWCGGPDRMNVYAVDAVSSSSASSIISETSTSLAAASSSVSETSTSLAPASSSVPDIASSSTSDTSSSSTDASASVTTSSAATITASTLPSSTTLVTTTTSTLSPSSTTTTSCTATPTFTAVPDTCWVSVPTACASLTRTPAIPWPAVTIPATQCRNAFVAGPTVVPEIASCFASVSSPLFSGSNAYNCVKNAPVFCHTVAGSCGADGAPVTPTPTPTDAVANGGFESGGLSSWSLSSSLGADSVLAVSVSSERPHRGAYSLKAVFSNINGGSRLYVQDIKLQPGVTYQASWWWYSTNSAALTVSRMQFSGGGIGFIKDAATSSGPAGQWVQATQTFTAGGSAGRVYFMIYGNVGSAGNTFYVDDISFVPVV